ncbi:MAG: adenylate/guanylate cyclase domain-containing protein, partial [bacterium]
MNSSVRSYLPRLLLDWFAKSASVERHNETAHQGILLFADASGFTALTRELSRRGPIGNELLTNLLNNMFTSLERAFSAYDGDILKFSGDAVWCYLPGEIDIARCHAQILTAVDALNRSQSICSEFPIGLHAGAELGDFCLASVGNADSRLEFEIHGQLIHTVYEACDLASNRQLALGPTLAAWVADSGTSLSSSGAFSLYEPLTETAGETLCEPRPRSEPDIDREDFALYVPITVRERLLNLADAAKLENELRKVTVLFASLSPLPQTNEIGAGRATEALQELCAAIFASVREHGGSVARLDPFKEGHKLLVLFGALSKSEGEKHTALKVAREITMLESDGFTVSVGLSSGHLFCGEVGSESR